MGLPRMFERLYLVDLRKPTASIRMEPLDFAKAFGAQGINVTFCSEDLLLASRIPRDSTKLRFLIFPPHSRVWKLFAPVLHGLFPNAAAWARRTRILTRRLKEAPGMVYAIAPPWEAGLVGLHAAKAARCPFVLYLQGPSTQKISSKIFKNWVRRVEAILVGGADAVVVPSALAKDRLAAEHGVKGEAAMLLPGGFAGPLPAVRPRSFEGKLEAVYLGTTDKSTQGQVFCEAYRILYARDPILAHELHVTYYGEATSFVKKRLFPLLVEYRVEFGGFLPEAALGPALARADIGLISLA
ncbi:MAG: glycosyltransferase, partial [Planctomycetota bacterium]